VDSFPIVPGALTNVQKSSGELEGECKPIGWGIKPQDHKVLKCAHTQGPLATGDRGEVGA
jgi:hypothetical protein